METKSNIPLKIPVPAIDAIYFHWNKLINASSGSIEKYGMKVDMNSMALVCQ